jgi:hypothetical protein
MTLMSYGGNKLQFKHNQWTFIFLNQKVTIIKGENTDKRLITCWKGSTVSVSEGGIKQERRIVYSWSWRKNTISWV